MAVWKHDMDARPALQQACTARASLTVGTSRGNGASRNDAATRVRDDSAYARLNPLRTSVASGYIRRRNAPRCPSTLPRGAAERESRRAGG
eukprot:227243-Chlamydomonas_euryale.AAC.15